jgi:hypothetical protein
MSTTDDTQTDASREAEQLRRAIEDQRSTLGRDLVALGDHVSPGAMVQRRRNAATQSLRSMKESLMGVADDAGSAVSGRASGLASAASGAPQAATDQVKGSPLVMGLLGFGAGLVAASVVPGTRTERNVAAKAEPALQQAAGQAGALVREDIDQLTPVAKQATEELRDDAADAARVVQEQASKGAATVQGQATDAAQHLREDTPRSPQG